MLKEYLMLSQVSWHLKEINISSTDTFIISYIIDKILVELDGSMYPRVSPMHIMIIFTCV